MEACYARVHGKGIMRPNFFCQSAKMVRWSLDYLYQPNDCERKSWKLKSMNERVTTSEGQLLM